MPTFDNGTSTFDGGGTVNSMTVSHTASGSNRLVLIDVHHFNGTISGVTYGGVACTLVTSVENTSNSALRLARYRLIAPATGAQNAIASFTGDPAVIGALLVHSYTDCDQTTPLGTSASAEGDSAGPATVNVSSASGELVADALFVFNPSITAGAGQTVNDADLEFENWGGNDFSSGSSTEAGAGTVTMSWTFGASGVWNIIGSPLKPPSGGATTLTPSQATVTINGRQVTTSAFQNVRIREVLVNASGQAVGSAANISLWVWYGGRPVGTADLSYAGLTTDANGTTSWSIATGSLAFNQRIFYVAAGSDSSLSAWTCAQMTPNYE